MKRALILLILAFSAIPAIAQTLRTEPVYSSGSFSRVFVSDIIQDGQGFMWLATSENVRRYDGREFKEYPVYNRGRVQDAVRITCLHISRAGVLYIGTEHGICSYDADTDKVIYAPEFSFLEGESVHQITQRDNGEYWISTKRGLYRKFPDGTFENWNKDNSAFTSNTVRSVIFDGDRAFITTFDGFYRMNVNSAQMQGVCLRDKTERGPVNNLCMCAIQSPYNRNEILVGTQTGFCAVDKNTLSYRIYNKRNTPQIVNNTIRTILQDGDSVWLGTEEGVMRYDGREFVHYSQDPKDIHSLTNTGINRIYKDRSGIIWIATEDGIAKMETELPSFEHYDLSRFSGDVISGAVLNSASIDSRGNIWTGSKKGLSCCLLSDASIKNIALTNSSDGTYNNIGGVAVDANDIAWLGTSDGVMCYDIRRGRIIQLQNTLSNRLKYIQEISVAEDGSVYALGRFGEVQIIRYAIGGQNGIRIISDEVIGLTQSATIMAVSSDDIWIAGDNNGLQRYSLISGESANYLPESASSSISSSVIQSLYWDKYSKKLWIGTAVGIDCYDPETDRFTDVTAQEPVQGVNTIQGDAEGHVWFTTDDRIGIYSPDTRTFRYYLISKWLSDGNKNFSVSMTSGDDIVVIGSKDCMRLNYSDLVSLSETAPLVVSDIKVNGNPSLGAHAAAEYIESRQPIRLKYDQGDITVSVSMLDYSAPETTSYKYILDGYDRQWRYLSNYRSSIEYNNLPPGKYTLIASAVSGSGIQAANRITLHVIVSKPWWLQWWMKLTYLALAAFAILLIVLSAHRRHERRQVLEMDKFKENLFAKISHDLKTPLALIMAPCETLIEEETSEEKRNKLSIIRQNADKLLLLVNQILEFKKAENVPVAVSVTNGDFVKAVRALCVNFMDIAAKKSLSLEFETDEGSLFFDFDREKTDRIFTNLLSNAVKFTPSGGQISVQLRRADMDNVEVMVADSGVGMSPEVCRYIFKPYYQGRNGVGLAKGSGLGLAIVKDFVDLLGGTITVSSTEGIGSAFTVRLPITGEIDKKEIALEPVQASKGECTILLVDDNDELRSYLGEELSSDYSVQTLSDAESAVEFINETLPELIILDVQLPKMSGIELCRKLKGDFLTSHIPVILLTAYASEQQKLDGFAAGADDYIEKPFNQKVLSTRISNLLARRQQFQDALRSTLEDDSSASEIITPEDEFFNKVMNLINENISDSDLSIPALSDMLAVSPAYFCRKMKSLTNMNPNAFIRELRLKKAAQMLSMKGMLVADVMYEVGFTHKSYFSKCFKEMYGMNPKEWSMKNSK